LKKRCSQSAAFNKDPDSKITGRKWTTTNNSILPSSVSCWWPHKDSGSAHVWPAQIA